MASMHSEKPMYMCSQKFLQNYIRNNSSVCLTDDYFVETSKCFAYVSHLLFTSTFSGSLSLVTLSAQEWPICTKLLLSGMYSSYSKCTVISFHME